MSPHTVPESLGIHNVVGQTDAEIILVRHRNYFESDTQRMSEQRDVTYPTRKRMLVVHGGVGGISGEVTWECLH